MSHFSIDSEDKEARATTRDSFFSYLSRLSSPRRLDGVKSTSATAPRRSRSSTAETSPHPTDPAMGRKKGRAVWSPIPFAAVLRSGQALVRGKVILPNNARRPSGPDTPHPARYAVDWPSRSPTGRALASVQRGALELRNGLDKARRKVAATGAERKHIELKKKIRLIGPADQFPDGRVSEWI